MSTVGVFASIFDDAGRILLVRHSYGLRRWGTPGGRLEPGESPIYALSREVAEEIGCEICITHLVGIYAKPYRDDLVLSFAAAIVSGVARPCPSEISDIMFSSRDSLPPEPAFNTRIRIQDAFEACCGIARVFANADSLAPTFDTHISSHTKA